METPEPPCSRDIVASQSSWTVLWHRSAPEIGAPGFMRLVAENHLRNFSLWHEEDVARRDDIGPEPVKKSKRAIDRFNQERNDFVEQMDKALFALLQPKESGVPFNSETPGMMIDRLSILALKEFHMAEQAGRADAGPDHREKCAFRLSIIRRQIADLSGALDALISETKAGSRSFRVYFQFKMYNDPAMNPQLYGAKPKA
ncbi:MAG TPA: DUF4254 domain-containing protein [Opitutales bacterium]|nr:DUF4254 domain-containing protein [Opitutales bacterium]